MDHLIADHDIFETLRETWQPVALSADVPLGQHCSVRVLAEDLVVARLPGGLLAARDHCPHRGARFGIGDVHDGHLRCPYHGWEFDHTGHCARIPSLPDQSHHARQQACLKHYAIQERYGMIWVRLAEAERSVLPDIPEYESDEWDYTVAQPMDFGTGFRREIDNYLDMSHFAFAHATTLGVAAADVIDGVRLTHHRDGVQMDAPFPALQDPEAKPGKLQQAHHRCQRVYLPNFTTIRQTFADGDERVLVHIPSPVDHQRCRVFWGLAVSKGFDGPPLGQQIQFAIKVLDEDRIMVENQRPLELPLGPEPGVTVPADRLAMSYKRAFREFISSNGKASMHHSSAEPGDVLGRLAVCWGSQTGNAERLAFSACEQLRSLGWSVDCLDLSTVWPQDLRDYQAVGFISSTYGAGDPPDNAKDFIKALEQSPADCLQGLPVAVCGLGDRRYEHFCACGKMLEAVLTACGAQMMTARVDCDVDYDEPFNDWLAALCLATMNRADLPVA